MAVLAFLIVFTVSGFCQTPNVTNTPTTATWQGGTGDWYPAHNGTSNWGCPTSTCGPPNNTGGRHPATWNAIIGGPNPGTVTLNSGGAEVNNLTIGDGTAGTLKVSGSNGLTVDDSIYVGETSGGTGTLSISGSNGFGFFGGSGGTVQSGASVIGDQSGSTGVVTVDGNNSTWTLGSGRSSADLTVGNDGTGTLTISGGATVSNKNGWVGNGSTGIGTVNVTGGGSSWSNSGTVYVGESGTGTLNISSSDEHGFGSGGASVSSTNGVIGDVSGSTGTVTLTGNNSSWTISGSGGFHPSGGNLTVGNGGTGTLNVESGSSVSASGTLTVGESGTGTLNITSSGGRFSPASTVSSANGIIGDQSGSTGSVNLTGNNSQWTISGDHNSGNLYVGNAGTGSLTINAGTEVTDSTGCVGCNGGSGTVTVAGEWSSTGSVNIGVNGTGVLTISDGGLVSSGTYGGHFDYPHFNPGTITIGTSGTVVDDGTLQGNVVNYGILDPTGTISGSLVGESGSTLTFNVTDGSDYDMLTIDGDTTFQSGSIINIVFAPGFTPSPDETFNFFNVSGGSFTNDGVTIEINGSPCTGCSENFSNSEFNVSVPEPGSWVLLLSALVALAVFALRKRRAGLPDLAV